MSDTSASPSPFPFAATNHAGVYDVAIIGAGPAGMSAAATAADNGLRVALIDAARQLGGQYFRHPPPGLTEEWMPKLYHGWERFEELVTRVETATGIEVLFDHQVWAIEPGFRVLTDRGPIEAPYVLLATGAYERVVPFPGWDLPGVLTAGGAQALLKGNLVLPGRRVVVAGTGPLLLPVAAGLATAGATVLGLYEANAIRGYAKNPIPLLTNPAKVAEGFDYARQFTRARIPVYTNRMVIEARGGEALEAVVVARPDGGDPEEIPCDTLAIGYGLAPQIDLALTLGAAPTHLSDGTVALQVSTTQRTTIPGLYAAGETAGVAGAETALTEGEIAALAIARAIHRTRAGRRKATAAFSDSAAGSGSAPLAGSAADDLVATSATATDSASVAGSAAADPAATSATATDSASAASSVADAPVAASTAASDLASLAGSGAADSAAATSESAPTGRRASRALAAARVRLSRSDRSSSEASPSTDTPAATPGAATAEPTVSEADPNRSLATRPLAAARARLTRAAAPAPETPPSAPAPPNLATLLRRRTRQRALADLLRTRHPIPAAWQQHLTPDTLVCRCEEVPVSAITEAVADLGAADARTAKLLTRAGMGWCQGRVCGYAVACLAAADSSAADPADPADPATPTEADLLATAKRPLSRPVPLGVIAEQDQRNK